MSDRAMDLDTPVQFVKGVGPWRATLLATLGVQTLADLIEHLPFRYERLPKSVPIGELILDSTATIVGAISGVRGQHSGPRNSFNADVVDGTGRCSVRWFNAPYLKDRIRKGQVIRLTGKVEAYRDTAQFVNPRFDLIAEDDDPFAEDADRFEPVYPAVAKLNSATIARIIAAVLPQACERVEEFLPDSFRVARRMPPRRTAFLRVHQPIGEQDAEVARKRLAYDELLLMQLAMHTARHNRRFAASASPILMTPEVDERIRKRFPFAFTPGQDQAVQEIATDIASPRPMNRLLQGDVGSGKTAVALYAALATIANRRQVAFLAPTEILATQHLQKVERYLSGSRVRFGLLVGGMPKGKRDALIQAAASGALDLLIGTHALIEDRVTLKDLGLLIVDEQHKFGVAQRAAAGSKGAAPHRLVMTATPIPRTLAMTFFGDLDITTIRDAPAGRRPVTTRIVRSNRLADAWRFLRERVANGEQAYIVYPLVDESDDLPLKAATDEVEKLRAGPLCGLPIGLVHGRQPTDERRSVMDAFRAGDISVLVSTTVIEVGVDVANATVMVIQNAERFGLSQLHQLRGRIGRGDRDSHCLLVSDTRQRKAADRLDVLSRYHDGFRIADEDLRQRGPGELLGKRQHGMPQLRAADLIEDLTLLETARDDAARIAADDPLLHDPAHAPLRRVLQQRYADIVAIASTG